MGKLITAIINRGAPKDDVINARLVGFHDIFGTCKPHQVGHGRTIKDMSHQPGAPRPHLKSFITEDVSTDLHERHFAVHLADFIDTASVYMFIGIIFQ